MVEHFCCCRFSGKNASPEYLIKELTRGIYLTAKTRVVNQIYEKK